MTIGNDFDNDPQDQPVLTLLAFLVACGLMYGVYVFLM
jgi:hypothetical protein